MAEPIEDLQKNLKQLSAAYKRFMQENMPPYEEGGTAHAFQNCFYNLVYLDKEKLKTDSEYRGVIMACLAWIDPKSDYGYLVPSRQRENTLIGDWVLRELPKCNITPDQLKLISRLVMDAEKKAPPAEYTLMKRTSMAVEAFLPPKIITTPKTIFERGYREEQEIIGGTDKDDRAAKIASNVLLGITGVIIGGAAIAGVVKENSSDNNKQPDAGAVPLVTLDYDPSRSSYVFDMAAEAQANKNGGTTLNADQNKLYMELKTLSDKVGYDSGKPDAIHEALFCGALRKIDGYDYETQKAVLGRLLFEGARDPKAPDQIADILSNCPFVMQRLQFSAGMPESQVSAGIIDMLKTGCSGLAGGQYDIVAWPDEAVQRAVNPDQKKDLFMR